MAGLGLLLGALLMSGCGLFGTGPEPTPTVADARQLVPTFTPTTVAQAQPTPTETLPPPTNTPMPTSPVTTTAAVTATGAITATATVTPTPVNRARALIEQDLVNARLGPGIDYGLAGEVTKGQSFEITGKNQQGDWWQVCCVNGQTVWLFGQLVQAENTEAVAVITDLPPKPVAAQPQNTPVPAQPTATPLPQVQAPPPAADPCATIGGDGCKFRVTGGPSYGVNGGTELKLQLMFKHSGDSNRPQGSYFVALFKDGQKLPVGDNVRSLVDVRQRGVLGEYNYEYKISPANIPGNTVAGTYTIYVLDGNGERDSQDFTLNVPEGQGEIWIEFDQG
jgi:uncharacterized protein YraI